MLTLGENARNGVLVTRPTEAVRRCKRGVNALLNQAPGHSAFAAGQKLLDVTVLNRC